MNPISLTLAGAVAFGAMTTAVDATAFDREELRARLVHIVKRLGAWTPPRASTESVACVGKDGAAVWFAASTLEDRRLSGPVRVRIAGKITTVPAALITTDRRADARLVMRAVRAPSKAELLSFEARPVSATAPQGRGTVSYAAIVSVNGGAKREVRCSAFAF